VFRGSRCGTTLHGALSPTTPYANVPTSSLGLDGRTLPAYLCTVCIGSETFRGCPPAEPLTNWDLREE